MGSTSILYLSLPLLSPIRQSIVVMIARVKAVVTLETISCLPSPTLSLPLSLSRSLFTSVNGKEKATARGRKFICHQFAARPRPKARPTEAEKRECRRNDRCPNGLLIESRVQVISGNSSYRFFVCALITRPRRVQRVGRLSAVAHSPNWASQCSNRTE